MKRALVALENHKIMKQERNDARQHHATNFVEQNRVHGKNPVVIGTGRDAEIHIEHVGDIYAPQLPTVRYLTEKTLQTRISVPAVQKGATWTCLIAGLGLVGNVLGILGWFGMSGPDLAPSLLMPCLIVAAVALCFAVSFRLLRTGVFQGLFGNWGIREDENRRLIVEKLQAICPICGDRIVLQRRSNQPCVGKCEKHGPHAFTFDPTTMSGVPWEITYFYL
jgi:hypothetical protein